MRQHIEPCDCCGGAGQGDTDYGDGTTFWDFCNYCNGTGEVLIYDDEAVDAAESEDQ